MSESPSPPSAAHEVNPCEVGPIRLLEPSTYQRFGCYGSFVNAVHVESGKKYMAQVFRPTACREFIQNHETIESNVALARSIKHPSIMRCYGKVENATTCVVLWESVKCAKGAWQEVCPSELYGQQLLILDLLTAIAILGEKRWYPLIAKDDDVLVVKSSRGRARAKVMPGDALADYTVAQPSTSIDRLPPEILAGDRVAPESPVWCVGVLAFEMITKSAAFGAAADLRKTFQRVGDCDLDREKLADLSPQAFHFFSSIFKPKENRASVNALLNHPWFDETASSEEKAEILCTDVLGKIISESLLPRDICDRLACCLPYAHRWALSDEVRRQAKQYAQHSQDVVDIAST